MADQNHPNHHYAPAKGWINDPNGLVYHDGIYELYYQHNPYGITWDDMHWGHARSRDLAHWTELPIALAPDADGTMFSGCAIRNDRGLLGLPKSAIVYYYTAAGGLTPESAGKDYTIRLAYSLDGGDTIVKTGKEVLAAPGAEKRDPKVFWHEKSQGYVMVLYLDGHDFGIFRSEDLEHFELTQQLTLDGGFECPGLFCLPVYQEREEPAASGKGRNPDTSNKKDAAGENGRNIVWPGLEDTGTCRWVFWAADGSYYVGDFDGFTFTQTQRKLMAYEDGRLSPAYAAQNWSGLPDGRVMNIAWLIGGNVGGIVTHTMTFPHDLFLVKGKFHVDGTGCAPDQEEYHLGMKLPDEIERQFRPVGQAVSAGEIIALDWASDTTPVTNPSGSGSAEQRSVEDTQPAQPDQEHSEPDGTVRLEVDADDHFTIVMRNAEGRPLLRLSYEPKRGFLFYGANRASKIMGIGTAHGLELTYDRGIVEICGNHGLKNLVADFAEERGEIPASVELEKGSDTILKVSVMR